MPDRDLWRRIKEARIVWVLLTFLGISWSVLQGVEFLQGALDLPHWVVPGSIGLLTLGLVVILATAWVQALPSTAERERSGEVPGDWDLAPRDLVESIAGGDLPHLTWGRSVLGGVFALGLLFTLAGLAVLFQGPLGPGGRPGASERASPPGSIAVVPFHVTAEGMEAWREGMVELLTARLADIGTLSTIESEIVYARWRERVEGTTTPDLATSMDVARSTGARYGLIGSLVGIPAGIRISAEVFDLASGERVAEGSEEGDAAEIGGMADRLSLALTRGLSEAGAGGGPDSG